MTWTLRHKWQFPPYVRSHCTMCCYALWICVCCQYVSALRQPTHVPDSNSTHTHLHKLSSQCSQDWHCLPWWLSQIVLQVWTTLMWLPNSNYTLIKIHHSSHWGRGHWLGWVASESDDKLVSWPPQRSRTASLASSARPGLVMVIVWKRKEDKYRTVRRYFTHWVKQSNGKTVRWETWKKEIVMKK